MRYIALFAVLLLAACTPAAPTLQDSNMPVVEPTVQTSEEVISPPQDLPEQEEEVMMEDVPPAPLENVESVPEPYSQLGCEQLITKEEFASSCGLDPELVSVTYKIGTKNCFINMKDLQNERLTAGISLTGYDSGVKAAEEFDRRLDVLKVGADKKVGERVYEMPNPPVDSSEVYFLRDEFIVKVNADVRLCEKDKLYEASKVVDGRLK